MKSRLRSLLTALSSGPRRHLKTTSVIMLLFTGVLIFFYSTLHLEVTYSLKPTRKDFTELPSQETHVNASGTFEKLVAHRGAYWNRLLFSALKNQGKGKDPSRKGSDWSKCRVKDLEILKASVSDFNSYSPLLQDFVQSKDCKTPPLLINQPNKCFSASGAKDDIFLLFAIKSTPVNFEQRQALRQTWGQEKISQTGHNVRTLFLMGKPQMDNPDLSVLLSLEAQHYGDILQWDFHDSFFNLTLKMSMFIQWTLKYCPQVTFVFSGDDDVFVNTPLLLTYLQSLEPSKASKLYGGHILSQTDPNRSPKSKYFIPVSYYGGIYPDYAGGGGFVLSGALLGPLQSISEVIPFYPIDDVYTGMCLHALGVTPEVNPHFYTFGINTKDSENLCVHKNLILVHQRSPQQLMRLWRGIHSPHLIC